MSPELVDMLHERHPTIFSTPGPRENSAPDGWFELIDTLCVALTPFWSEDTSVFQIKEKFGGLRFYTAGVREEHRDTVDALIRDAEHLSVTLCEICGEDGARSNYEGHVRTLCASHSAEFTAQRVAAQAEHEEYLKSLK